MDTLPPGFVLPPGPLPIPLPPALTPGEIVLAFIQSVVTPGRVYMADVAGILMEMELEKPAQPGEKLTLRVLDTGPRQSTFQLVEERERPPLRARPAPEETESLETVLWPMRSLERRARRLRCPSSLLLTGVWFAAPHLADL